MKSIKLFAYPVVAALSLVAAVAAHAEGPISVNVASVKAEKTRADVQAEVLQARARGEQTNGAAALDPLAFLQVQPAEVPRATLFAGKGRVQRGAK